ncbi:hypothetical protein VTK56DRAFT_7316 [Thermocarpiscus australiensis]
MPPTGNRTPLATSPAYGPNTTLRIREHLPPEPFTDDYGPNPRPPIDWNRFKHAGESESYRVEFALAYPPIETEPPGKLERTLTITGIKTRRERGGAHVVTCFLDGDRSAEYVAKIYDGVDYPLWPSHRGSLVLDCMSQADRDYSIEAWAYRMMQPVIGGTVVPAYFGSWTFALDTGRPNQQRWVRMILIELIQGECMLDMIIRAEDKCRKYEVDYSLLPPEHFRLRVLQNILEAHLTIWWEAAVTHDDMDPRNVIVKPDGSVVLVDFNQAYICEFTAMHDKHAKKQNPTLLPPSPIERYWPIPGGFASSVRDGGAWGHWVPQSWLQNKELAAQWLVETYRNTTRFRPPAQWFLDWECHESGSEKLLQLLESIGRKPARAENSSSPTSQAQVASSKR